MAIFDPLTTVHTLTALFYEHNKLYSAVMDMFHWVSENKNKHLRFGVLTHTQERSSFGSCIWIFAQAEQRIALTSHTFF